MDVNCGQFIFISINDWHMMNTLASVLCQIYGLVHTQFM